MDQQAVISTGIRRSLRAVAIFEAVKGGLVLIVGFGLLGLLRKDGHDISLRIISRLHLNPLHKYPAIFIDLASSLNNTRFWWMAAMAAFYSTFRFVEGYGLWHERAWAEWLAALSGAVYIPVELYELCAKVTWLRLVVLGLNILVVLLMAFVLRQKRRPPPAAPPPAAPP